MKKYPQIYKKQYETSTNSKFRIVTRFINNLLKKKVYTSVLRNADSQVVDEFFQMYKESSTPEEKERLAVLLGEVCSSELIDKVLSFAISVSLFYQLP